MATYNVGWDRTFKADVDLSASQYSFVKASSTAGNVELQATAAASCLGVLQNDPKASEEATVRVLGFSKVRANASASVITYGGFIKSGSDGMACGYTNSTASQFSQGIAMEALTGGTSPVYIEAFIWPALKGEF